MNFKPGDKVWIDNPPGGMYPVGTYAAVLIRIYVTRPSTCRNFDPFEGWWAVDIEEIPTVNGRYPLAHETQMRRRDDPQPQQEPKQHREPTGECDLCPWQPTRVTTTA